MYYKDNNCNLFKWENSISFSLEFERGLLTEDKTNPIIPITENFSKKKLAEIATFIVGALINETSKVNKPSIIISRKDLCFILKVSKPLINYGLKVLLNAEAINISRKGTINGTSIVSLNNERLSEIENIGREIFLKEEKELSEKKKESLEKDKKKIEYNLYRKKANARWSKEKTEAINKMAYGVIEDEDKYNTDLIFEERCLIQILSKAWLRFSGYILKWDYMMFNKVRATLIGKMEKFHSKEEYINNFRINTPAQKLIDIVKFMTSVWFDALTECNTLTFELMFMDAYNKGFKNIIETFYEKSYESVYSLNPSIPEDFEYYKNKVDVENINSKVKQRPRKNPFNNINIHINPGNKLYAKIPAYLVENFNIKYNKFNSGVSEENKEVKQESIILKEDEDPCALFKSLK